MRGSNSYLLSGGCSHISGQESSPCSQVSLLNNRVSTDAACLFIPYNMVIDVPQCSACKATFYYSSRDDAAEQGPESDLGE